MEAEFIALSSALRDLIPARHILQAIGTALNLPIAKGALLKSTVFEDNNGCLTLATVPKMTPRSKHIGVKYFWFRSKVGPGTGITIQKCDTKDMLADIFTKGLPADQFAVLRASLMGWTQVREGVSQDKPISVGFMSYLHRYSRNFLLHADARDVIAETCVVPDSWAIAQN
jgi:hypothetical protein